MRNLFRYSYKLVPTDKPDVVYLVPTASTYMKAFGPSVAVVVALGGAVAVGTYIQYREQKKLDALTLDNLTD